MNAKSLFLIAFLTLSLFLTGSAEDAVSVQKTNEEWQAHTYPRIGLKIKLPNWKTDIEDQGRRWSLLAYPLVESPITDVQYRIVISAIKLPEEEHLRIYPKPGTNSTDWMNSQHLQTSQMTNAFWIYSRRDVFGSNGFAYFCEGSIKRDANLKPKDVHQLDGDEEKLAIEVRKILDSIEVLSTNSATKP
ncbi:MAG: hypothetical protein ABSH11_01780 [Verrucomicrobiota bacterium]|jgi:hypothetical protein